MNILLDMLPESITLGGAEYPINTDFRVSILFEIMMQDDTISDKQKTINALELYYPALPPGNLIEEAVDKLLWFYRAGKEENKPRQDSESDETESRVQRIYSFDYDDDYIYSAFYTQYRLDLQDIEYLHWWKFKAMFKSLDDDCQFSKIMGYRSIKITSDMSKKQKAFYRHMKAVHALPVPQEERERTDAITQALLHGGDLRGLL